VGRPAWRKDISGREWECTDEVDGRRGQTKGDEAAKGEDMALCSDGGGPVDHQGDSSLGCTVEALERPGEEGHAV